jgi:hypothetical protein
MNFRDSFEYRKWMELTGIQWQVYSLGFAQICGSAATDFE